MKPDGDMKALHRPSLWAGVVLGLLLGLVVVPLVWEAAPAHLKRALKVSWGSDGENPM